MYSFNKLTKVFKAGITARMNAFLIGSFITGLITSVTTAQTSGTVQSFGEKISAKKFYSSTINEDNTVWFLTESGIVSFDGTKWTTYKIKDGLASNNILTLAVKKMLSGLVPMMVCPV